MTTNRKGATDAKSASTSKEPAAASLILDGEGPAWMQIRRVLAAPILDGSWPPGTRVPAEVDLQHHFQTSRMTVNKAIQNLAFEGLVQRRRGFGTIVAKRAQERPVFEMWNTANVVQLSGAVYGYRLLEQQLVNEDPIKRALLNVSRKTRVLWMRCVHLSDGRPFQLEERLINVDAAPGVLSHPLADESAGPWLIANVPWTEAEHTVSAQSAGPAESDALDVPIGSPCLVVERRTWNEDKPVSLARLWHPGSQHLLVGRFLPTG